MATSYTDSTGAATSGGSFSAPGLSVAEIETMVETMTGLDTDTAAQLVRIDQAITAAGQAAATWQGRKWWWLETDGSFDTEDTVGTYALRTVNSNDMVDLFSVVSVVIDDDYPLNRWKGNESQYRKYVTLLASDSGQPTQYGLWGDLTMGLLPVPNAEYTITVSYIRRQGKISSGAGLLIVPAEWHWSVYVVGAAWLIRHETADVGSLKDCPEFYNAMMDMAASDPTMGYSDDEDGEIDDPRTRTFRNPSTMTIP